MRIQWAVFGEVKKGHDVIAASSEASFASKITQYTDRPGDPPQGLNWGPVVSGFPLDDQYVLLRTQPDPGAGRAGMVRSYAAFVPVGSLARLNNIAAVLSLLPTGLARPDSTLEPLDVPDDVLTQIPSVDSPSGLMSLVVCLTAPESRFPLVWASAEPYLPSVAALWGRLPVTLRPAFAFAFQFAPEVRMPMVPTLVATPPPLANRWPTVQVLPSQPADSTELDTAQRWLAGLPDGDAFSDLLARFDMEVTHFNKLGLLASFAELMARLPHVSFSEAKRAVNIVAQYGRRTAFAAPARTTLFDRLCSLVATASSDDLLGLRNLDSAALVDLVPSLQAALQTWLARLSLDEPWSPSQLALLEHSVTKPASWWSMPFSDWLRAQARSPDPPRAPGLVRMFVSAPLSQFFGKALPATKNTEDLLLAALPDSLTVPHADNILSLAERRRWMRLHARVLLRSRPAQEAALLHAKIAGDDHAGLDDLHANIGTRVFVEAAGETGHTVLLRFAGRILARPQTNFTTDLPSSCLHRVALLRETLSASEAGMPDQLRSEVRRTLVDPSTDDENLADLCSVCADHRPELLLDLPDLTTTLIRLPPAAQQKITVALSRFLLQEVVVGRPLQVASPSAVERLLDTGAVVKALASASPRNRVRSGVNAFRCLRFLTDEHCCHWLIDLFTRTQFQPLSQSDAAEIAALLADGNYPKAANVVRETVEQFHRRDVAPIDERIRYAYQMAKAYHRAPTISSSTEALPKVIVATALPLEREAVMHHLPAARYDNQLYADVAPWPNADPLFEVYVITTGAGNLSAQAAMLRASNQGVAPALAFFVGVCGAVKDSAIGDVVYSTKVYYYEGGKEEDGGVKARPAIENTAEALVQLAHRVAPKPWQPQSGTNSQLPKASPAVIGSGELVLASKDSSAANLTLIKAAFNDTQVVDMEAYGFMKAMRDADVRLAMVVRGVSDKISGKSDADGKGSQPLAVKNAVAFLFALLRDCDDLLPRRREKRKGFLSFFMNGGE